MELLFKSGRIPSCFNHIANMQNFLFEIPLVILMVILRRFLFTLIHVLFRSANLSCWPPYYDSRRNIFCYTSTSGNNTVVSNGYPRQNGATCAYKAVVPNSNSSKLKCAFVLFLISKHPSGTIVCNQRNVTRYLCVIAN